MVNINLFLSNTEDMITVEAKNGTEFYNLVTKELKISSFTILFEHGEKISRKKMHKFDEIMNKKYKGQQIIDLLLITTDNCNYGKSKLEDEMRSLFQKLERSGHLNDSYFNTTSIDTKKILETVCFLDNEFKKFRNQTKIISFLKHFYQNMLDKMDKQLFHFNESNAKYKYKREFLEESFVPCVLEFKEALFHINPIANDNNEFNIDIKIIEKAFVEFKKFFSIFEEKLKHFNSTFQSYKDKNLNKINENNLIPMTEVLSGIQEKILLMHYEIMNILDNKSNLKDILINIENIWNSNKMNTLSESFTHLSKLRKINSLKIKSMLEDECLRSKKGIIEKLAEINFYKNTLDDNLELSLLPQIIKGEIEDIKKEIHIRKEFDYAFHKIMDFLNHKFLPREEKRRKEYSDKMKKYCKNDLYKRIFNKLYERFSSDNNANTHLEKNIIRIEDDLFSVLDYMYQETSQKKNRNEELTKNVDIEHIRSNDILNEYKEFLNKIKHDLQKLFKQNFNLKDFKDIYPLSKQNSEAALLDKEEEFNKKFGVGINCPNNHILENSQEIILKEIKDGFIEIQTLIKKVKEISKPLDTSLNLDISSSSLINSIYLSNMITNDKHGSNYNNYNHLDNFNGQEAKTNIIEIEKFVLQHEDKLFFYDAFFDYMNNFIKARRVSFNLIRDKPATLGNLIENILKDLIRSKTNLEKYKLKLRQLIANK